MLSIFPLNRNYQLIFNNWQRAGGRLVAINNHLVGSISAAPESSSFNVSPIILGCLLTLLILCCVVVSKIYSRKRAHSDETLNGSKQSNALLCKQELSKVLTRGFE